jgi:cell fate regulator YaaT (PSP1 superfamily)
VELNHVHEYGTVVHLEEREGDAAPRPGMATAVRRATLQDQARALENAVVGRMAAKTALKRIEDLRLGIRLVRVRYSLERSVLHITYTAEERVDAHELVKSLAADLHVRVEIRQIGVRDGARLIGGLGPCGRQLCCRTWLSDFAAVGVKMAKLQRLSLNPGTIGGMCGRLKCCLRYEYDLYRRLGERLPRDGARVQCPEGEGWVADKDILGQRIRVRLQDGRILEYEAAQVTAAGQEPAPAADENGEEEGGMADESPRA